MIAPIPPTDELKRLARLRSLQILDTPPEERFDRATRLAARVFDVPIAVISLVDADRQWFKSKVGVEAEGTPRAISFCGHAILERGPFLVPDARLDERFHDNPLVTGELGIRFYAGQPLRLDPEVSGLGTLCLIDRKPRELSPDEVAALQDLAEIVVSELQALELSDAMQRLGILREQVEELESILPVCMCTYCKSVRVDDDYWEHVEHYLGKHNQVRITHGTCEPCALEHVIPEFERLGRPLPPELAYLLD
ncbi:MAG TPA: diguanylate cyclase [Planctomycetes bacterium]|nr:diguanylate cyclase [Planctomycetota bacterium]